MGSFDSAQKLLESSFYREFVGSDEGDYTFNFNTEYEYMFMVGTWRTKDYSDSVGRWYPPEGDVKTLKFLPAVWSGDFVATSSKYLQIGLSSVALISLYI